MKGIITILCILLSLTPLATQAETLTQISRQLDTLIQKTDPTMNSGVYVMDLANKTVIYSHNADREYTPASTEKVLTAAAAMLHFGPTHRYLTQLLSNAPTSQSGVLQGNLFVKLDADPSLKREDLLRLFTQLRRNRITQISGNILIDSRDLANVTYGPGWMREDSRYGFGAKVGPVILDENRFSIYVAPGSKPGDKAYIKIMEPETPIMIDNQLSTRGGKGCGIGIKMDDNNVMHFTGCISANSSASYERLAVKNPLKYMEDSIRSVLAELQIQFTGQMTLTTSIPNGRLLAQHKSRPLSFIIQQTLKPSDNLYAESLYLKLGSTIYQQPSNWDLGRMAVQSVLTKYANVNFQDSHLSDGSGLSRYNLVTPRILVGVLSYMYHYFPVSSEFVSALPIAGIDGTLVKRMKEAPRSSYIRAKTGTMKGITALTGYVYTTHGQLFAFAIMSNNVSGGIYRYRALQDQIVKYLSKTQV